MKTLCITGNTAFNLEYITDILAAAGMQRALPSRQDATLTMQAWHDQVCSAYPPAESALQIESPGRFWNQMAGDIFLANYTSALWGWSSQGSIRLLDYWLAFDPSIMFLLLYTDPVTALAEAISSELPQEKIPGFLSDWHASTQEMLRIYNRHPERCLLLEYRQCSAAPADLLQLCNQRRGLTLNSSTAIPVSSAEMPPPLPIYLAHASLQERPELYELQREIESTYVQLPSAKSIQADQVRPPLDAVVNEYRSLLATETRATQQRDTIQELQARLLESGKDAADLRQQLRLAKEQAGTAAEENELLILQLHQVQEELEHYFLLHQQLQQQNSQMEIRWKRMLERQPEYTEYSSITVEQDPEERANLTAGWRIRNLEAAGRCHDEFRFNTVIENEVCGIKLKRDAINSPAPLLRWPLAAASERELLLIPVGTMETIMPRVEALLELSTSDWDLLNNLQRLLVSAIQRQEIELPSGFQTDQLATALENLGDRMLKVPPAFRYNKVTLKNAQTNPDYEHLWLQFEGVSFADRRWSHFEFRLSCADVRPDSFGDLPKLEFPEGAGQAPLKNWFAESSDDFGPKFELRFNLLNSAMDMAVWQRLTTSDQEFIRSLAAGVSRIFTVLKVEGVELARPWQQWTDMGERVARLLFTLTKPSGQVSGQ